MSEIRPSLFRRLLRLRLASLLALVAVVCWLYHLKLRERAVADELSLLGCWVYYDCDFDSDGSGKDPLSPAPGPVWLRAILGDDIFASPLAAGVDEPLLVSTSRSDAERNARRERCIWLLRQLPTLKEVWLYKGYPAAYEQALSGVKVTPVPYGREAEESDGRYRAASGPHSRQTKTPGSLTGG